MKKTLLLECSRFCVEKVEYGSEEKPLAKEVIRHPGAVTILPVLADGRLVLIRNYRIAVEEALIELPTGTLDTPGESPLEAAARELREETGYRAGHLQELISFYMSPGILEERMTLFLASALEEGEKELQEGEEIETVLVKPGDALQWIAEKKIKDAKTILALLYWDRFWRNDIPE